MIGSLAAVALLAAPALAELSPINIPQGSYTIRPYDVNDVERQYDPSAGIYNNTTGPTRYSINNAGKFVGDDVHMTGATVTGFQWIYVDNGPGSHTSTLAFFYNTPGDAGPLLGNTATFTFGGITYGAVFSVSGLPESTTTNPAGGWLITVGLPAFFTGTDAWVGIASNSTTPTRAGLRAGNVPTVGSSHDLYWSGFYVTPPYTSFFTVTAPVGDADLRIAVLPEPAAAALLAMGGLLALRRRRAKA
jgi:MYXO-CTERM domain-containing protein